MKYSIRLEKYKNKNQKHICPKCGKRTFVLFYDYDNQCYINENVGKCDRATECGHSYSPKEYYRDNPFDKKPRTLVPKRGSTNGTNNTRKKNESQLNTIPFSYIEKAVQNSSNHLIQFLLTLFDTERIKEAIAPYFIGSTKDGRIVFPQIDADGKVRTAKIMEYNSLTGKRIKEGLNAFDWIHSILMKKGLLPDNYELETCLFGEHLIRSDRNNGKTICILESEKSVLIAAIHEPQYLWVATGGLNSLNVNKLKPLKDWNIILYPDTDTNSVAFHKWSKIADEARKMGFNISVSTLLERICTPEQKAKGYDLGDFIIDEVKSKVVQPIETTPKNELSTDNDTLNTMIKQNPVMIDFINKFDLILTQII